MSPLPTPASLESATLSEKKNKNNMVAKTKTKQRNNSDSSSSVDKRLLAYLPDSTSSSNVNATSRKKHHCYGSRYNNNDDFEEPRKRQKVRGLVNNSSLIDLTELDDEREQLGDLNNVVGQHSMLTQELALHDVEDNVTTVIADRHQRIKEEYDEDVEESLVSRNSSDKSPDRKPPSITTTNKKSPQFNSTFAIKTEATTTPTPSTTTSATLSTAMSNTATVASTNTALPFLNTIVSPLCKLKSSQDYKGDNTNDPYNYKNNNSKRDNNIKHNNNSPLSNSPPKPGVDNYSQDSFDFDTRSMNQAIISATSSTECGSQFNSQTFLYTTRVLDHSQESCNYNNSQYFADHQAYPASQDSFLTLDSTNTLGPLLEAVQIRESDAANSDNADYNWKLYHDAMKKEMFDNEEVDEINVAIKQETAQVKTESSTSVTADNVCSISAAIKVEPSDETDNKENAKNMKTTTSTTTVKYVAIKKEKKDGSTSDSTPTCDSVDTTSARYEDVTDDVVIDIAKWAQEALNKPHLARQMYFAMALERGETFKGRRKAIKQADLPPPHTEVKPNFQWSHFPPLERTLKDHAEEYYTLSILTTTKTTKEQLQFNSDLVISIREVMQAHHWPSFNLTDKYLRDRIRCYYKTHIQNAKKRLHTMLRNPTKKANMVHLKEHNQLWQRLRKSEQDEQNKGEQNNVVDK